MLLIRSILICFGLWLVLLTGTGCAGGGPVVPPGYAERPATSGDLVEPDDPRLQIIICYGQVTSHVLIRLVDEGEPLLLWDPGGLYGLDNPKAASPYRRANPAVRREADVVHEGIPSLSEYWTYRQHLEARNQSIAIFEWALTSDQLVRLHTPLATGMTLDGQRFATRVRGMWCGTATGDYLKKFAPDLLPHAGNDLNPATMTNRLWKKDHPSRVILFTQDALWIYEPTR